MTKDFLSLSKAPALNASPKTPEEAIRTQIIIDITLLADFLNLVLRQATIAIAEIVISATNMTVENLEAPVFGTS